MVSLLSEGLRCAAVISLSKLHMKLRFCHSS